MRRRRCEYPFPPSSLPPSLLPSLPSLPLFPPSSLSSLYSPSLPPSLSSSLPLFLPPSQYCFKSGTQHIDTWGEGNENTPFLCPPFLPPSLSSVLPSSLPLFLPSSLPLNIVLRVVHSIFPETTLFVGATIPNYHLTQATPSLLLQ